MIRRITKLPEDRLTLAEDGAQKSFAMPGSKEETQRAIKLVEAGQTKAIARPRVKARK